jgi:hypothetical protein
MWIARSHSIYAYDVKASDVLSAVYSDTVRIEFTNPAYRLRTRVDHKMGYYVVSMGYRR